MRSVGWIPTKNHICSEILGKVSKLLFLAKKSVFSFSNHLYFFQRKVTHTLKRYLPLPPLVVKLYYLADRCDAHSKKLSLFCKKKLFCQIKNRICSEFLKSVAMVVWKALPAWA